MKNLVLRRLLYGLLTIAIVVSAICTTTRVASAGQVLNVRVANESDRAVWYILFWSYRLKTGWEIENSFCVGPKQSRIQSIVYNYPQLGPQVRLEAQVKRGASDCGGPSDTVQKHTWEDKKDVFVYYSRLNADLVGRDGDYHFEVSY